ncbi:YihY/virulence factor BrkB family protein [Halobacteriales archaeon QS_1_69_70]|nr:MAG: YihY/virulence factor BrkB family protein [Halobacteriales archaeon QS_1_69_70]
MSDRPEATAVSLEETVHDVVAVTRRGQVTMLAASLAYFGISSLVPFAFLGIALLSRLGGGAWDERVTDATVTVLGDDLGRPAAEAVLGTDPRLPSTVVAVTLLLWGTLRLYRSSDRAFTAVYGERKSASILSRFRNAAVVFATNTAALALFCAVGVWFSSTGLLATVLAPVVLLVALVAVFLPMFYVFPTPDVTLREVLPGTALAAAAWAVASVAFRAYAGVANAGTYGALGALLLVSTWLYLGALAMLSGAAWNAVLGGRVDPDDEWVPTDYM